MSKYTKGPWIIVERQHPYKDGSKSHIERNIYTEWVHPQLKGGWPIVCTSVGIGMNGEKAISFSYIDEANARLISAAPDLLEALQSYSLPIDMNNIAVSRIEFGNEAVEKELKRRAAIAKALGKTP